MSNQSSLGTFFKKLRTKKKKKKKKTPPSAPTTGPGHDGALTVNMDLLPAIVEHVDVKRPVQTATAQV